MKGKGFHIIIAVLLSISSCKTRHQGLSAKDGKGKARQTEKRQLFLEALSLETTGRLEAALQTYQKCAEIDPQDASVPYAMSALYHTGNNPSQAIAYAERAVELDDTNPWYKVHLANLYYAVGNFPAAGKMYELAIAYFPTNDRYYFAFAECLVRTGKYDDAIKVYNKAEALVGPMQELFRQKFLLYQELGKTEAALNELDRMVQIDPSDPGLWIQRAEALEQAGRSEEAFKAFNKVLELDPENGYAILGRARYFERTDQDDKVLAEMVRAFRSQGLHIDMKVKILLDYYDQTGEDNLYLKEAYNLLEALLETHPDDAKAYSIYGDFLARDNRTLEARDMFLRSVRLAKDNFIIWNEVLVLDVQLSDWDSLHVHGKQAVELFPNQAPFYYFAGLGGLQSKDYESAIQLLNEGRNYVILPDQNDLDFEFLQALGDAHHAMGRNEEAYGLYEQALQIDPENIYVLNNYAYYLSLDGIQLEKAAVMAMKANKLSPNQPSYQDTYGWILYKQGQFDDAVFLDKKGHR